MNDQLTPIALDDKTVAFYLTVEPSQIVIFQALIESYEMFGTVRTIDIQRSLIAIIAPLDQVSDCQRLLSSLKKEIPWKSAAGTVQELGLTCITDEH